MTTTDTTAPCWAPHPDRPNVTCSGQQGHTGMHHHHGTEVSAWWTNTTTPARSAA